MLIRRKSSTDDEYHHQDIRGYYQTVSNSTKAVAYGALYDIYGNLRFESGACQSKFISQNRKWLTGVFEQDTRNYCVLDSARTLSVTCPVTVILPIYGKCCGPQTVTFPGGGIDPLDNCCCAHDRCYSTNGCNVINRLWKSSCQMCDAVLCVCASHAACTSYICQMVRGAIKDIMCSSPLWPF